jgi:TIR domain
LREVGSDNHAENAKHMPRLFISYSRQDEVFARRLATSLSQMGADIWIDIQDIPAGMKWSSAIQQGLDVCDAMLVIITPSSSASQNVEDEWQYYRDRGKPIVPVLVHPTQLHYQLSRIQHINFQNQPYDIALTQLHAELYRKGIMLRPPPNVATAPIAAMRQQNTPAYGAHPVAPRTQAPPAPARKSGGGRSLLTIGCVGLLLLGALGAGGFLLLNNVPNPDAAIQTLTAEASGVASRITLTPTNTPDLATPIPDAPEVVVGAESARLRTGPGVTYASVDAFALFGERYSVIAQARSAENTEDWFLIQHPTAGRVWLSAVVVDLQPDGVIVPTAATVPPTPTITPLPTLTATPLPTPTAAGRTLSLSGQILFAGQRYEAGFNAQNYTRLSVDVRRDATLDPYLLTILDSTGNVLTTSTTYILDYPVAPNADYTVRLEATAGGTGALEIVVQLMN